MAPLNLWSSGPCMLLQQLATPRQCENASPLGIRQKTRMRLALRTHLRHRSPNFCSSAPQKGYTALILAARNGHLEAARCLLAAGASAAAVDKVSAWRWGMLKVAGGSGKGLHSFLGCLLPPLPAGCDFFVFFHSYVSVCANLTLCWGVGDSHSIP